VTTPYVIGVDLGASITRVLVADLTGRCVGHGMAGGGNPISRGIEATVANLSLAIDAAMVGIAPSLVGRAVLGVAGIVTFGEAVGAAVDQVWATTGLSCPRELRSDIEVAYAAGTAEPDGFILISGTGAVAAHIRDGYAVRSVDGHGWLLGDRGSGYWIGREAVLVVLAAADGVGPMTSLQPAVARALGLGPADLTSAVIGRAVYQRPPIALAELAPLVTAEAALGDGVARSIVERAGHLLLESLIAVHREAGSPPRLPVVTGGGLLAAYEPLRRAVQGGIALLGLVPYVAEAPAVGAVALAIRSMTPDSVRCGDVPARCVPALGAPAG
jgi:N-acetylglucosamine kinase-like BadF-type ATPase